VKLTDVLKPTIERECHHHHYHQNEIFRVA